MTRSKTQKLIKRKAQQVLAAERQYWARHDSLLRTFGENAAIAGVDPIESRRLISRVFGFRDACVLVRFQGLANYGFQVIDIDAPSAKWQEFVRIPVEYDGEIVEIRTGRVLGIGGIFVNCSVRFGDSGPYEIPYLQMLKCEYHDNADLEDAIHDLSVTIAGALAGRGRTTEQDVIRLHEQLLSRFTHLLDQTAAEKAKEEILQVFLKENPLLLIPNGRVIPKQKLGEDFCTDFVLIDMLDQGPKYTLVEIEKSSHEVFTKKGELRSEVQHAIHQTLQWDVWLQKHSSYLRAKLPGFETPNYIIIIGRSTDFTDENREFLRAYNRRLNNTQLITYDDVVRSFADRIEAMKSRFTSPCTTL
jgi:antiviral defense system Shedu protein SduA